MRLNPDCIRDILLTVEEQCDMNHSVALTNNASERLQKYTPDEIAYHARQSDLSGLLYKARLDLLNTYTVSDLTPAGHNFLADIRKDTLWNGVKEIAKDVGSTSLKALVQIASNVVTEIIKAKFQLNA